MTFSRYTESEIRQLLGVLDLGDSPEPKEVALRLEQLRRGLEAEDEFSLVLSWLGKCDLVHKLSQEQLPVSSTDKYRVPDLLAVFDHKERKIPVLIEVKKTAKPKLSLKPGYLRYADALGLPMLVAWQHRTFWTLFEMRRAHLAAVNYRIDFDQAMAENLLGLLAGDLSYSIAPGTTIQQRIRKLGGTDKKGGFDGVFEDVYFLNAAGDRLPSIPHLHLLFLIWENDAEIIEEGDLVIQSFVISDIPFGEFASRTLSRLVQVFASLEEKDVNWRAIMHNTKHWVHERGRLQAVVEEGAKHGVIARIIRIRPRTPPDFLQASKCNQPLQPMGSAQG